MGIEKESIKSEQYVAKKEDCLEKTNFVTSSLLVKVLDLPPQLLLNI